MAFGWILVSCAVWYYGAISRQDHYSFSMGDIVAQGFESSWGTFSTLGYYEEVAEQYKRGNGAIQIQQLKLF
jgi:hypothetical protein